MRTRSAYFYYGFAAVLVVALLTLNIYRAATQSITVDEAFTYTESVEPPLRTVMSSYDANHHILYSLTARLTMALLPKSELTLRLPALFAGAVFLTAVCVLCARALGPSLLFAAGIGLVGLNPFVLDYLSAARGYGLALACWFSGLLAFLAGFQGARAGRLIAAGSLGAMLAVAANLTFAFPVAGLLWTVLILLIATRRYRTIPAVVLPVVIAGALLLVSPLRHARPSHFYHGTDTLSQSLESLGTYTFFYTTDRFTLTGMPYWITSSQRRVLSHLRIALLILGAGTALVTLRGVWRARRGRDMNELTLLLVLLGGSSLLGGLLLIGGHHLFGVKYPASRTGLFWIVSASMLGPLLAGKLRQLSRSSRPVTAFLAVSGLACAAYLASQVRTTDYAEWRFDSGTRDMVQRIEALRQKEEPARVGVTWTLASSMEFYRRVWELDWEPVRRMPLEELERNAVSGAFHYIVLLPADHHVLQRIGWRPIYRDRRTDAILAGPPASGTMRQTGAQTQADVAYSGSQRLVKIA